jgi:hypothetical protein
MEQELRKTLKEGSYHPELHLSDDIWHSIVVRRKRKNTVNTTSNILATSFFVALFIPIVADLVSEFKQSGFYEYTSLLFSDTGLVARYWKEYIMSVVDSLPTTSLILTSLLVLVILILVRRTISSLKSPLAAV